MFLTMKNNDLGFDFCLLIFRVLIFPRFFPHSFGPLKYLSTFSQDFFMLNLADIVVLLLINKTSFAVTLSLRILER